MAKKFFGETDGVRGKANYYPMDAETMLKLGKALAEYTKKKAVPNPNRPFKVIIAKDTRRSGYMLEQALTAGFLSRGVDVMAVGPMPTPSISHLVRSFDLDLGVMITASHNAYHDNGLKIFSNTGNKLTDEEEIEVEDIFFNFEDNGQDEVGRAKRIEDVSGRYIEFIKSIVDNASLRGYKVVVDCANGATYNTAPTVFRELGAFVIPIGVEPNGYNINVDSGSLHPENVKETVLREKADLGIALDGDGDRVIMIDEKGQIIDGDYIMALIAKDMKEHRKLSKDTVVLTNYSNLALDKELEKHEIKVDKVVNGDRAIANLCLKKGYNFGGEQSGHFIFFDYTDTGDGTLTALQVMRIMTERDKKLSEIAYTFEKYPQKTFNVEVKEKKPLEGLTELNENIKKWEDGFGGNGRVFVRYSGTENLLRIMVEAEDGSKVEGAGKDLVSVAEKLLK